MKTLRIIAERIFLGRNSGNLAERFQDHLLLAVPLLLASGAGAGFIPVLNRLDGASPIVQVLLITITIAMIASIIVVGYVLLVSLLLTVLGLTAKGAKSEDA